MHRNKKLARLLSSVFVPILLFANVSHSQKSPCGTVVSPEKITAERSRVARGESPGTLLLPPSTYPYYIPLTIHICRQTNGAGGITQDQLQNAMRHLNELFAQANMVFFVHGSVIYINNDLFYRIADNQFQRDLLRQQNPVANTINVYFTLLDGLCGQSSFPDDPVQGVLVDSSCTGSDAKPSTFAHEIGHYLDLLHTHETAFGVECPDGSNCSGAGDLLCDTPADPNLNDLVSASCNYLGGVMDPCGTSGYAPQTSNLMSYSTATCRNFLTLQQRGRMLTTLEPGGSRANLHALIRYVDASWSGSQTGSPHSPYRTLGLASTLAPVGARVYVRSGSYNETPLLNKALRIGRWNSSGTVIVGQ